MKKFTYKYSDLQHDVLTNSDRTNLKRLSSGGLDIFVPPDDILEDAIVPEITYTETNAVSVDKTVKAWTYYCDSLSGCVEGTEHYEDGDGSAETPWRSVEYAIKEIYEKFSCITGFCCDRGYLFQLKVKGILDYEFQLHRDFTYWNKQNLIIAPWSNNYVVISGGRWHYIKGIIFNNFHLLTHAYFYECMRSVFNHIFCQITNPDEYGIFNNCVDSKFIDISGELSEIPQEVWVAYDTRLFYKCDFIDVIGINLTKGYLSGYNCKYCKLYNVIINVSYQQGDRSPLYGTYFGIMGISNSNFYNCSVTLTVSNMDTYKRIFGYLGCYNGNFYTCSASVYGVLSCQHSDRYNKDYGYVVALGFWQNTDSNFYNCTTTNQCDKCADDTYVCETPDF